MNIAVDPWLAFYVPNIFTPNADGLNDSFSFVGAGVDDSDFRMDIFNRWGNLVYHSTDRDGSWDGKYMGAPVSDGVYAWVIHFLDQKSKSLHKYQGMVTVIK